MKKPRVLFCTAAGSNYGLGHLRRALSIIDEGRDCFDGFLDIRKGDRKAVLDSLHMFKGYSFLSGSSQERDFDLIVSDMRDTSRYEMKRLVHQAPVISLDDQGAGKDLAYVTINAFPVPGNGCGNFAGSSFIVLDSRIKKVHQKPFDQKQGVLISFGGSDPCNLSGSIGSLLNSFGIKPVIVQGPFFKGRIEELDAEIVSHPSNMYDLINSARVIVTSFGITMFEAFFLRTPVLLYNHSAYHTALSREFPVINLGYRGSVSKEELSDGLKRTIEDQMLLEKSVKATQAIVDGEGAARIVSIMKRALKGERKDCFFRHRCYRAITRSDELTLFRCARCKDLFLYELQKRGDRYDRDYFFTEYRKRYGRSYREDKENIGRLGVRRLQQIESLTRKRGSILDVGCALGFFLQLARERGWDAWGIEISEYASRWAQNRLGLNVINGSFLQVNIEPETFDVVTLFFVIEHFPNMEEVIQRVHSILKKNGLIVLALPHRGGILYRLSRSLYLKEHPRDHYFDTTTRNLRRLLRQYGFIKRKIRVTGIHPERFFPKVGILRSNRFFNALYTITAKTLYLGDTFEYYGIKA